MTGERVVSSGKVHQIFDAERYVDFDESWFERRRWEMEGAVIHSRTGRGAVLMLERGSETWVYRHYHRGGIPARFVYDHYLWTGLERSRPFREWRLLKRMYGQSLPVPRPVAARAVQFGPVYQADLITVLLPETRPLSSILSEAKVEVGIWSKIGMMLRKFHDRGVDHPDLTAHNILVDTRGDVFLVDFDNADLKEAGQWRQSRMSRLQRSLRKVALETGTQFDESAWDLLYSAYGEAQA